MTKKTPFLNALLIMTSLIISSCVSSLPDQAEVNLEPETFEALGRFKKEYVLVPGDQIEISVWRVPEVSRTVVIRPDGNITLPTLRDVQTAGLTFPELTAELTRLLSERLLNPHVTVIALQTRQPRVYVLGDVNNQMAIPLRTAGTAAEAIASAGGIKRSGKVKNVSIIRLGQDGILRAIVVEPQGSGQPDPYLTLSVTKLQADDVIFVPESRRNEITRFLNDFINRPLTSLNLVISSYADFKLIEQLN